ncbi:MAG TPA: glucose-1-phosphate adenylyltransferase [Stellaceae bacterium]|nr:glucose-1-phosphate adenylyltransferase [Stellaceae bacterium]
MERPDTNRQSLPKSAIALVLAGGRGTRLQQLTDRRAKPAVYFGGKFRIVDFALSNCLNSGIRRIGVVTQYSSHSLLRHLQRGWAFLHPELNEFIDLLPAQQRMGDASWYRGTADAVLQNLDIIRSYGPKYLVILAGDHIYKMDYGVMLSFHVEQGAPCTVGCIDVPLAEATEFGVMAADERNRITQFVEKPKNPPPMADNPDRALASMGIYVFDVEFLYAELERDLADPNSSHDFGKDIIPSVVARGLATAHPFRMSCVSTDPAAEPFWRDVGTIDAYWRTNIDLTLPTPALDMYDRNWPIWTHQEQLAPAKFVFDDDDRRGSAVDSLVSGGCIISGSTIRRSVLFSRCRINSYCAVEEAVLLPDVQVGRHARLRKVVVDRGCVIPEGLVVGEDAAADAERFTRTAGGVTLITRDMLARLR